MLCARCGHRFNHRGGIVTIHFSRGSTALEQLQSWHKRELCWGCGELLKAWMGPADDPIHLTPALRPDGDE